MDALDERIRSLIRACAADPDGIDLHKLDNAVRALRADLETGKPSRQKHRDACAQARGMDAPPVVRTGQGDYARDWPEPKED